MLLVVTRVVLLHVSCSYRTRGPKPFRICLTGIGSTFSDSAGIIGAFQTGMMLHNKAAGILDVERLSCAGDRDFVMDKSQPRITWWVSKLPAAFVRQQGMVH